MYVCLCAFYWGSSLCTFALKQMDFNWRDPTLSVTKRRYRLNIISKLKPQTIQHITYILSLSLSHTHSDRFLSERWRGDSLYISKIWIWYFFCSKEWLCQRLNHCPGMTCLLFVLFLPLYSGVFLKLCSIVLKHAAWFQLQPDVKQQCPMLPFINLVSTHYHTS